MAFKIDDKAIHLSHGLGVIEGIEDRTIHDQSVSCYVFRTPSLTVWVPITDGDQQTLRAPKSKNQIKKLFPILQSQYEPLPEDYTKRQKHLKDLLTDGNLNSMFRVVRELSEFKNNNKLSDAEKSILERTQTSILEEWAYSFSIPVANARKKMTELIESSASQSS